MFQTEKVAQHEIVASLTDYVLELMNRLDSKSDMKMILSNISPEYVQLLANAALPKEYYEICQAAKEIQKNRL